jgi:uncharacterized protein
MTGPLVTRVEHQSMLAGREAGVATLDCSLDLGRSRTLIALEQAGWNWRGSHYPDLNPCRERTVYHWDGSGFQAVARFGTSLIKLVPTSWGTPTFEIDGIKMLPSAQLSPWEDARNKVALIQPRGKTVLDTCGGLGYFAAWCLQGEAARVMSFERNADVLWLRSLNPWSPAGDPRLSLTHGDIVEQITLLAGNSVDAILHDPPRFGIAGELYSSDFYRQMARVLRRNGKLFHYIGTPNRLGSGRDVPAEVTLRLRSAGFVSSAHGDGVLAVNRKAA